MSPTLCAGLHSSSVVGRAVSEVNVVRANPARGCCLDVSLGEVLNTGTDNRVVLCITQVCCPSLCRRAFIARRVITATAGGVSPFSIRGVSHSQE